MRSNLGVIGLATLVVAWTLAAGGTAGAQRINYGGQGPSDVSVFYYDVPPGTQLLLVNQINGVEIASGVGALSGTGLINVPFTPLPAGPGQYYVRARNAGLWVGQTVVFYVLIP
jgi:hypothetical protein